MREIKFRAWDKQKKKMISYDKLFALDASFVGKQLKSNSYEGFEYWQNKIEVIGNIYEHPHLLKEE